jgi:hypothetical protein
VRVRGGPGGTATSSAKRAGNAMDRVRDGQHKLQRSRHACRVVRLTFHVPGAIASPTSVAGGGGADLDALGDVMRNQLG